ncbi:MAG: peptidoglycan DD-metalloendopeptidase family protein [Actinomycetota bacterium]|nr:peptidoglycan DD-metalloendopeptidase family protein [Actinomycetota bacterium]
MGILMAGGGAVAVAAAVSLGGPGPAAWPVEPAGVVRPFDPPAATWLAGHRGLDLAAAPAAPVRAMLAGTVRFAGEVAGKPVVVVSHPSGLRSTYEPVLASVRVGTDVATGQQIGRLAVSGGHCGGLVGCLHVGLRAGDTYLDPLRLLRPPSIVLKPVGAPRAPRPAGVPERRSP